MLSFGNFFILNCWGKNATSALYEGFHYKIFHAEPKKKKVLGYEELVNNSEKQRPIHFH